MMPSVSPASQPTPEQRLEKLESQFGELKKKPKDIWDRVQSLSGLISGLMVAVVGYYFTVSINHAQFQFSSAKEMQELLTKFNDPKTTADDKESIALVLAAFGTYAIQPLINQLQSTESNRSIAAEAGLRAIGYADPKNTCRELVRVLDNRTAIFAWHTHLSAIRLMRDAGCAASVPALQRYQRFLDTPDYKRFLREEPTPTLENVNELRQAITGSLQVLQPGSTAPH